MAAALTGETQHSWSAPTVDIARIEAELARLRYDAAGSPAEGEDFALRTSFLNLVVYAADRARADEAGRIIAALNRDHPSRAIIIVPSPTEEESQVDVRLSAHCHVAPGTPQHVCCEEVQLGIRGRAANHLHSIIIPLLVPDLPVYVWWTGPLPRGRHLFEEMMETADRFIVDSGRFRHPTHGLLRVAELCAGTPGCAVGDLAWARMAIWRDLVARHSSAPDIRRHLTHANRLEIGYIPNTEGQLPGQTFLLVGWIASRLGWDLSSVQRTGPGEISLPGPRGLIELQFSSSQDGEIGSLGRVALRCSSNGDEASVSVQRLADPSHFDVSVFDPGYQAEERFRAEPPDPGDLLASELEILPGRASEYAGVLQTALPLIRAMNIAHDR